MNDNKSFRSKLVDTSLSGIALKEVLMQLKASSLPLFIYGAGHFAELAHKCIVEPENIRIDEYVVTNVEKRNETSFMGNNVTSFSEAAEKYTKFNVIVAAGLGSKVVREQLISHPKVEQVYLVDFGFAYMFPDKPYYDEDFIKSHDTELMEVYNNLSDDKSKQTMIAYFNQRITGYPHYTLATYENNQYYPDMVKLSDGEVFIDCGAYIGDTIEIFIENAKAKNISIDKVYAFEPNKESHEMLIKNERIIIGGGGGLYSPSRK